MSYIQNMVNNIIPVFLNSDRFFISYVQQDYSILLQWNLPIGHSDHSIAIQLWSLYLYRGGLFIQVQVTDGLIRVFP